MDDLNEGAALAETGETELERVWTRVRNYGFSVGDWNFILPAGLYSEVLTEPAITPLPNSPSHFSGLTNVRGNLVPVYRLDGWLNQSSTTAAPGSIRPGYALLIDDLPSGAAVVIDDKPRALDLSRYKRLGGFPEATPDWLRTVVDTVYKIDEAYWCQLNHQALFMRLCEVMPHDD